MPDITIPQLGETVTEGTITRWFKQVGDSVAEDEVLFEVSTDKVDSEVPSPVAGVLTEIRVPEGDTVDVGEVIAVVGDSAAAPAAPRPPTPPPRRRPRLRPRHRPSRHRRPPPNPLRHRPSPRRRPSTARPRPPPLPAPRPSLLHLRLHQRPPATDCCCRRRPPVDHRERPRSRPTHRDRCRRPDHPQRRAQGASTPARPVRRRRPPRPRPRPPRCRRPRPHQQRRRRRRWSPPSWRRAAVSPSRSTTSGCVPASTWWRPRPPPRTS